MIIENKPNVEFKFNNSADVNNLSKMETEAHQLKASNFSNNTSNESTSTSTLTTTANYEHINSNNLNSFDLQTVLANSSSQYMPKCPLCEKTFANSSNLKHHMNTIHFNEAKWICNECGKVCTSKSNLKVHLRVHLRVKPYYCRWCDYNCMHHSSIRDHLSKCHPEKSHNSCEPGYIFNSAAVPEPESTHFEPSLKSSNDFNQEETKAKSPTNSIVPSKVLKFKNKVIMKKKLKKKIKINQNGKKHQHESLISESNENSKNNLEENEENGLDDEDDEEDTNEEYDEKNDSETVQTNDQIANNDDDICAEDDEEIEQRHDEFNRNLGQTRRSSYSISSNKTENSNNRRISYSNIQNSMTPLLLSNFSNKNTTTASSSSSSSSLSPNTSNKLHALSNLPGLANLIQQQSNSDFLASLFPINGASDASKKSSQIQLNNIASTLMQHLNAAALFNQYNNSNQASSIVDCLSNAGAIPFTSNLNNFSVNSSNNLNAALDLTIKNDSSVSNKKKSITECSDEYTSSLSPVSTSSTLSSNSLKNSQSFTSIKSKSSHQDKRIRDTSMTSHKKSGNKAISDVINRLNLNLPSSHDHEHDDESHNTAKMLSFKKLCTKNMKETQCDNLEEDKHDQREEEEYDEEESNNSKESQHKLNEIHQENQSEPSGYKCIHCNIIFTEYPLYSIHAGMHNCNNPWQCSVCGHTCGNKIDFNVHILHLSKI